MIVNSGFERFGFSVVEESCLSPVSTLAHEWGHNMGARHDWLVDNDTTPHTYAHGYSQYSSALAHSDGVQQRVLRSVVQLHAGPVLVQSCRGVRRRANGHSRRHEVELPDRQCQQRLVRRRRPPFLNETAPTVANFRRFPRRALSDFTPDLRSDLLWRGTAGDMWLWPMEGMVAGPEQYMSTVAQAWQIVSIGDHTGDGTADLLWRHATTGAMYLWPMKNGTPQPEEYVATVSPAYEIVGTGDYDGDGEADLLWRHVTNGDMWLWRMQGALRLDEEYVATVAPAYVVRGAGDLNGDGKTDLVWRHVTQGDVWVWLMSGPVAAVSYVATVWDPAYQVKAVGDFTGDLKADILWHHTTLGTVYLWTMNGATRSTETWVTTVWNTNYQVAAAGDYDGDGKTDLVWRHVTHTGMRGCGR